MRADLDVIIANAMQNNELYRNDGLGNLLPVSTAGSVTQTLAGTAQFADFDGNGTINFAEFTKVMTAHDIFSANKKANDETKPLMCKPA